MPKRPSGGGAPAKAKAAKKGKPGALQVPPDALLLPHIRNENLTQKNKTLDLFLSEKTYSSEADLAQEGTSLFLRPYMLPHRIDFGLRGTSDGEVQHQLCQLELLNGFQTNPNTPGVEKLVACSVQTSWLQKPPTQLTSADLNHPGAAGPGQIFLVKGYNRSLCALGILYAAFDKPELLQELPDPVRESFKVVYATAVRSDSSYIVSTNRGVALGSLVRRRPNCFNLLHQLQFLERSGMSQDMTVKSLEAHESVSAFAQAYSLGEKESAAAINLLKFIPQDVKESLTELVRFDLRHADADILQLLEHTVPPADVAKIGIFLQPLKRYQDEVRVHVINHSHKLSAQLLNTTFQQTELQCESDMVKLRDWAQKFEVYAAKQAGLDWKHINDRYHKGRTSVEEFMNKKHQVTRVSSLVLAHAPLVQQQAKNGSTGLTILVGDFTLWPSRALAIDEAVNLAQSVASGNANTVSLAGVSGNHSAIAFTKSKALLGSVSGVERARVQDLQNPDVDKALAPHWRVQQRGIKATQDIIMKMLEGMNECDGQKVLIVDLNPSRFCEWSQAAWEMQRDYLLGEEGGNKWDIHFMGVYHDSDGHWMDANKDLITGRALSQWWDKSDEAGPAARISEPFALECPTLECLAISDGGVKVPDMVQQKFAATHHEPLKKIEEKISQDASVQKAIQMTESGSSSAGPTQSRTMGSPQWENETPLNWRKTLSLAGISVNADGSQTPMCYRYVIQAAPKINAFKPRELASTDDRLHLRAAQFGALWCGKLHQLPKATHCTVIWEAQCSKHKHIESMMLNSNIYCLNIFSLNSLHD
ncbi:unnamed protein product [Cladocopium goreaui]|uniref:Uncharacterized protein n=1 Tax=Cladocopium goreaui TaxID=2562237 RepID=A0A9P1G014_9DINO|nr:unnamed protein product [Cladocopium goreaui]